MTLTRNEGIGLFVVINGSFILELPFCGIFYNFVVVNPTSDVLFKERSTIYGLPCGNFALVGASRGGRISQGFCSDPRCGPWREGLRGIGGKDQ